MTYVMLSAHHSSEECSRHCSNCFSFVIISSWNMCGALSTIVSRHWNKNVEYNIVMGFLSVMTNLELGSISGMIVGRRQKLGDVLILS